MSISTINPSLHRLGPTTSRWPLAPCHLSPALCHAFSLHLHLSCLARCITLYPASEHSGSRRERAGSGRAEGGSLNDKDRNVPRLAKKPVNLFDASCWRGHTHHPPDTTTLPPTYTHSIQHFIIIPTVVKLQ